MNSAPALYTLPAIITEPGYYVTRCGERVHVHKPSPRMGFACEGIYSTGQHERWDKSGRLYFGIECQNDIVSKA